MRLLIIIIPILLFSCSNQEPKIQYDFTSQEEQNIVDSTEKILTEYKVSEVNDEYGRRNYIDSLNFSIVRRWFDNGNLFIEHISNLETKIESSKEYYENGNLKHEGLMIYANHNYIGEWKYYSEKGTLDSIVDYDKKQPISYYKALNIAKEKGFIMPEIEKTYDNEKMFWRVNRWTVNNNETGRTAETILINSETGKVSIPEYQIISSH